MATAATLRWVFCAVIVGATSMVCASEMYRWVDENGQVHFGDRPPNQASAENVGTELKPINTSDSNGAARTAGKSAQAGSRQAALDRAYRERRRAEQQQVKAQQQRWQQTCEEARHQLRILEGPVYYVDAQGKEYTVSEKERQRRADALRVTIHQRCG